MPDLIPLDKLISRLRTDLKLTQTSWVIKTNGTATSHSTQNTNKRKASMLWYLERLKELDPSL